jgi:cobaltochelatase CobN
MERLMGTLVFLTNADTELLALRSIWEELPDEAPELVARMQSEDLDLGELTAGAVVVIVRVLGGLRSFPALASLAKELAARQVPLLCFPGDAQVDPEMVELSSVQGGLWKTAFSYLINGGLANYRNLLLFVSDTLLGTGCGFDAPMLIPQVGIYSDHRCGRADAPRAVVVFYRAHLIAGNTSFVDDLAHALLERGFDVTAVYVYSLRSQKGEERDSEASPFGLLRSLDPDVVVTTVWASGSFDIESSSWESPEFALLGCPVLQGIVATTSKSTWEQSDHGLRPADVAMNVAIPEFDGRIITFPFAFKEMIDDDDLFGSEIYAYRCDSERTAKLASLAWNLASLRSLANEDKKVAIILSAYPTKKSRLGNAVGLDSPASAMLLLHRLRAAGYRLRASQSPPMN